VNPRRLQVGLRRACYALAAAGVLYLFWRYDTQYLPEERATPLRRFPAGSRLFVDRHPPGYAPGDAVIFRVVEEGAPRLYLGLVESVVPAGAAPRDVRGLCVASDDPAWPGPDYAGFGTIDRADCRSRVLFVWPW